MFEDLLRAPMSGPETSATSEHHLDLGINLLLQSLCSPAAAALQRSWANRKEEGWIEENVNLLRLTPFALPQMEL